MITYLYVDGFKSLVKFGMRLKTGLNVLIGPNGAGKSNVCQALGLIAAASEDSLGDYILSLGGVTSVFTIGCPEKSETGRYRKLRLLCRGSTSYKRGNERINLQYQYRLELRHAEDTLFVGSETFRLYKTLSKNRRLLVTTARRVRKKNTYIIEFPNPSEAGPIPHIGRTEKKLELYPRGPRSTILSVLPLISLYCAVVREDLGFSRAWNIDPHVARRGADILEPLIMQPDGKGLPNALHYMAEDSKVQWQRLADFMVHVLPTFNHVKASLAADSMTRSFSIHDSRGVSCPASCVSDGTVKALALLVGVLSQPNSTSIIEEPENYLHPWAAHSLIDFFRGHFSHSVCVLTTHSETVLNAVKPREIVVIENMHGTSVPRRPLGRQSLAKAISESGFGPGYHYVTGALGGVPE